MSFFASMLMGSVCASASLVGNPETLRNPSLMLNPNSAYRALRRSRAPCITAYTFVLGMLHLCQLCSLPPGTDSHWAMSMRHSSGASGSSLCQLSMGRLLPHALQATNAATTVFGERRKKPLQVTPESHWLSRTASKALRSPQSAPSAGPGLAVAQET